MQLKTGIIIVLLFAGFTLYPIQTLIITILLWLSCLIHVFITTHKEVKE